VENKSLNDSRGAERSQPSSFCEMLLYFRHGLTQIRRIHNVVPLEGGLREMSRDLHGDVSRNTGTDQIPNAAPPKVVNQQALVLPNFRTSLHSQSYLNACGLKRLPQVPQVPSIEHRAFRRQAFHRLGKLDRKGQEDRLVVLDLTFGRGGSSPMAGRSSS
jgi:hypothetical protein